MISKSKVQSPKSKDQKPMKNILITGGAGFIGSHLVDRMLASNDWKITVVDDLNDFYKPAIKRENVRHHLANPRYKLAEVDIRERPALDHIFRETSFDCIVHLAARAGVRPSLFPTQLLTQTNIHGKLKLLEVANAHYVQ